MDYVKICVFFHVLILTLLILYCCAGLSEAVKLLHFLSWSLFLNKRDCVLRGKNVLPRNLLQCLNFLRTLWFKNILTFAITAGETENQTRLMLQRCKQPFCLGFAISQFVLTTILTSS